MELDERPDLADCDLEALEKHYPWLVRDMERHLGIHTDQCKVCHGSGGIDSYEPSMVSSNPWVTVGCMACDGTGWRT